jgi:acetolactate synthase-1/3 small subunit
VASDSLTIEITGDEDKIESMFKLLKGFGIREIARTGRVAMVRGNISGGASDKAAGSRAKSKSPD